jgi:hypothetical protein
VLIREKGTPRNEGSSQAMALTWTTNSGGETPGAAGTRLLVKPRKALFKEPLSPPGDDQPAGIQTGGNLIVVQPFGGQQDHLGPEDMIIR